MNDREFPSLKKHLDEFYDKLYSREDKGYTPYNLRSCAYMDDFDKQKIIYSEIVQSPKFFLDKNGKFYPEASAFYMLGDFLEELIEYLNSPLSGWIFKTFYAGGGLGNNGYRYKKCFITSLPVPHGKSKDFFKNFNFTEEEIAYINQHCKNALKY